MRVPDPFRYFILILIFFGFYSVLHAQYYNLGQDPASLKWRQIITPHFRLIYPETFEGKARRMMSGSDSIYVAVSKTLAYRPARLPVIIHNYNTTPNAVTVWAPGRIEMYTNPGQDTYAEDWMTQLMTHEYRHVVQIDRTNQGFTKVLSYLAGEQAAAAVNGLFVPTWFMEGDAVCTETALSQSGRGRIPRFEMLLRTQVLQKGAYSYDKAAMGSYRTFVPGKYELGYTLVANVRRKFSYNAWVTALNEVARKPFLVTPFNYGLKKATGMGKEKLYNLTMHEMDSMWRNQDGKTRTTAFKLLTLQDKKKYTNYNFPAYLNDSLLLAEVTGMDDITRFVAIGPKGYHNIEVTPGFLSSDEFSVVRIPEKQSGSEISLSKSTKPSYLLAWTEDISDPRWGQRNYSEIRIYSSQTNRIKKLTSRSRYFAPAFSPDAHELAVVSTTPGYSCSILRMNTETGNVNEVIIRSDTNFYMTPGWSANGRQIVFTELGTQGKSIIIYDIVKKQLRTLVDPTFTEISNPVFAGNYVLFNGSYSGIENIYAVEISNREIFKVTSAKFGASDACLSSDGKRLVYSDYAATGYGIAETSFDPASWEKLSETRDFSPSLYKFLLEEEHGQHTFTMADSALYTSQPYKKAAHIFHFHSWAPAYINYMSGENGTGISFMSQNELSTATTVLGYKYDMAEKMGKVTADFSWRAWYPYIDVRASYGGRAFFTNDTIPVHYTFNETVLSGGLTLPLLFTGGKYYKGFSAEIHTSWTDVAQNTSPQHEKLSGTIQSMDYSIYLYRYLKQSVKDIYPRWGQALRLNYRNTPFGTNNLGDVFSAVSHLYFPGLALHHGFRFDGYWQHRNFGSKYYFANQISFPRGYLSVNQETVKYLALNYKFPFAYPDFSLGPLVYVKRLKANLFYDRGVGSTHGIDQKLESTGVELTSDMHFLRFVFPMELGVRLGYLPQSRQYFSDLLFSVNLSN